ncbi:hypothetical protein HMI51_43575, partial [Corallococcus coralloides]|nr:hypothetical protein [Corallococcus coralloides]
MTIVAETEPDLVGGKSCPLHGRVKKISRVNGQINWVYENAVNNQRGRENQPLDATGNIESFIAEARRWGSRLHVDNRLLPFVAHKKAETPKKGEAKPEKAPSHKTVTMDELKATPIDELYLEMRVLNSLGYE